MPPEQRAAPRAVLILGMHRSGTSCLTGCLEEAGLALGEVNRRAPNNRKGNCENRRVVRLNEDLLRYNAATWYDVPDRLRWTDKHRRRRARILDEYDGLPIFGIKDPRALATLAFWREAELPLAYVGTYRHPIAVAQSLRKRDSFSMSRSLALWGAYNRILARACEELAFDVVCFDLPQPEYAARVGNVARRLGLEPPEGGFSFFESSLRHRGFADGPLPADVSRLYERLRRLQVH